jgi:aerobic carbon-monoxide dehydrogenase large subunit
VSPSTTNDLGAKGVGEAGCIASTPAVVNAIVDALRPLGVSDIRMPCTPERVWRAIQSAGTQQADATTDSAQPHFEEGAPNQDVPDAGGGGTGSAQKGADQ